MGDERMDSGIDGVLARLERDRGALHSELRVLVTAYGDDELTSADRERVEAHLVSCERCRRDLATQLLLRDRLAQLDVTIVARQEKRVRDMLRVTDSAVVLPARTDLGATVADGATPPVRTIGGHSRGARTITVWSGWLVAAAMAGILVTRSLPSERHGSPLQVASAERGGIGEMSLDSTPVPMVEAALADYEVRTRGELPAAVHNADSLLASLPFRVAPLRGGGSRVVAVWMTEIRGEPAAAVAYRWHDQVVVQYTVSERLFFRQARVRHAVARGAMYAVRQGAVSAVAWPNSSSGSILVGNASPLELAQLRS